MVYTASVLMAFGATVGVAVKLTLAATGTAPTIILTSRATVKPTPNILVNFFFIDL